MANAFGLDEKAKTASWNSGFTIIYCPTRNETEAIAEYLKNYKVKVAAYHAGMTEETRKTGMMTLFALFVLLL